MAVAKILAGFAAVGTISAGAAVAHQYGLISKAVGDFEKEVAEILTDFVKEVEEQLKQKAKEAREKSINWFNENIGKNKWEVKVIEPDDKRETPLAESVPVNLTENLLEKEGNKEFFKSLAEGEKTTFIFETEDYKSWKHKLTKEHVLNWIKNTSESKATLKLVNCNEPKELESIKDNDLEKLLGNLRNKKSAFENIALPEEQNTKNVLFELDGETWKHSKSEISNWLTTTEEAKDKFEIKIKKDSDSAKTLDSADENDLIGLFKHLNTNEYKQELLKYKNPTEGKKVALTLKKDQNNWKLVYGDTIGDWIDSISEKKAKLELYDGEDSEKPLSGINSDDELKQLFTALIEEKNKDLFKKVEGHEENSKKTVVFEKYGKDGNNKSWLHVKEAIKQLITDLSEGCNEECKLKAEEIKIQTSEDPKKEEKVEAAKDSELIGLLKHIKENWESYKKETTLTLKKDNDSKKWQKTTTEKESQ